MRARDWLILFWRSLKGILNRKLWGLLDPAITAATHWSLSPRLPAKAGRHVLIWSSVKKMSWQNVLRKPEEKLLRAKAPLHNWQRQLELLMYFWMASLVLVQDCR